MEHHKLFEGGYPAPGLSADEIPVRFNTPRRSAPSTLKIGLPPGTLKESSSEHSLPDEPSVAR